MVVLTAVADAANRSGGAGQPPPPSPTPFLSTTTAAPEAAAAAGCGSNNFLFSLLWDRRPNRRGQPAPPALPHPSLPSSCSPPPPYMQHLNNLATGAPAMTQPLILILARPHPLSQPCHALTTSLPPPLSPYPVSPCLAPTSLFTPYSDSLPDTIPRLDVINPSTPSFLRTCSR